MIGIIISCIVIAFCSIATYIVCVDNNYPEWKAFLASLIFPLFWLAWFIYFGIITKDLWR